jgi:hypothetical protein
MDRELARQVKKARLDEKRSEGRVDISVGGFARALSEVLMSDGNSIYNADEDEVLEILMEMREILDDKACSAAIKKAVKMVKVKDVQSSVGELRELCFS